MEVVELFTSLESNQPQVVEDMKKKFHELFNDTKESWLMNGLFEYYVNSGSIRSVEIVVGVREPHDKFLFDRLADSMRGPLKLQGLTLLGHVVRRHPTWLYKITNHNLMKDIIRLLKNEVDHLPLMSALLVLILLLPVIAGLVGPILHDIFEVFSRLASWNTNNPNKLPEGHLLRLQVSLFALFQYLYGMYPCNFLSFLRHEYSHRDNLAIFSHTIKPMLDTVKLHPLLVTASKDAETAAARWKSMEAHDVIVECAKFAVDSAERTREDYQSSSSISQSNLEFTPTIDVRHCDKDGGMLKIAAFSSQLNCNKDLWSPTVYCSSMAPESTPTSIPHTPSSQNYMVNTTFSQHEGTSPPEAAVEATPETTPIKDVRYIVRSAPLNSSVVRALGNSLSACGATPSLSQPSSPIKKEPSIFHFPSSDHASPSAFPQPIAALDLKRDPVTKKLHRLMLDRNQINSNGPASLVVEPKPVGLMRPKTPGGSSGGGGGFQPSSPLRVISGAMWGNGPLSPNSPGPEHNEEDREVEIMMQHHENALPPPMSLEGKRGGECDSVLQELDHHEVDYEECQQESGSPCISGGLHMPNSRSMLDFARQVHRLRFYSQCAPDITNKHGLSSGSSPGEGSRFPVDAKVRRAISCPEMKKSVSSIVGADVVSRALEEKEEEEPAQEKPVLNGYKEDVREHSTNGTVSPHTALVTTSTQTDDQIPLPYEHMFLGLFPPADCASPQLFPNKIACFSPSEELETYINTAVLSHTDSKKPKTPYCLEVELRTCREHLALLNLQLQFERHRREVHAERNRRLLGKSRINRTIEEHNSALRDQLSLLQRDNESLRSELERNRQTAMQQAQQLQESLTYWQKQNNALQKQCKDSKIESDILEQELKIEKEKTAAATKEWYETKAEVFDLKNELNQALMAAKVGRELRIELECLQRELTFSGEIQHRYVERMTHVSMQRQRSAESLLLQEAYSQQVIGLQQVVEGKSNALDAALTRVGELEGSLAHHDQLLAEQKSLFDTAKHEYSEQLEAVESKYVTLRAIINKQEEHMLELYRRLEVGVEPTQAEEPGAEPGSKKSQHSPVSFIGSTGGNLSISANDNTPVKNLQLLIERSVEAERDLLSPSPSTMTN